MRKASWRRTKALRSWRAARQKSWAQAGQSEAQAEVKVEVPVRAGHRGVGGGQESGWQAARKGKRKLAGTLEARHRGLPP